MPNQPQKSKTDPLHADLQPVTDPEPETAEAKDTKPKKPLTGIEKVKAELIKKGELCNLDWQPVAEAKEFNISSTRGLLKWPKDGGLVVLNHEDGNAAVKLLSGWRPNDGIRLVPAK